MKMSESGNPAAFRRRGGGFGDGGGGAGGVAGLDFDELLIDGAGKLAVGVGGSGLGEGAHR